MESELLPAEHIGRREYLLRATTISQEKNETFNYQGNFLSIENVPLR